MFTSTIAKNNSHFFVVTRLFLRCLQTTFNQGLLESIDQVKSFCFRICLIGQNYYLKNGLNYKNIPRNNYKYLYVEKFGKHK